MVGLKEICALVLAGSMGAGSVVTVQQVKAPQAKVKAKPKAHRPAPRPVSQPAAIDCPTVSSLGGGMAELGPMVPMDAAPMAGLSTTGLPAGGGTLPSIVGGGGGSGPSAFPGVPVEPEFPVSGVPEPVSWTMMVSGFGLIGFAMRRRPARSARIPETTRP